VKKPSAVGWAGAVLLAALWVAPATGQTAKGDAKAEKRVVLAEHETLAVFEGVEYRLCPGRTALCPKTCGDSGEFARFTIQKYLKYKKHGEYGDPEQKTFQVQVSDYDRKPRGDPKILETVRGLKKGDAVLLSWRHEYVTRAGASFPERPIVKLEKADKGKEAAKGPAAAPPKPDLLVGLWEGTWSSTSNGMGDSLNCTVSKSEDGKYVANFEAVFGKVFTHKSTVTLTVTVDGEKWRFRGEQDLGVLSGGVYTYEGHTDGKEFYSTYDSTLDKGTFQMKRAEKADPPAAAQPAAGGQ